MICKIQLLPNSTIFVMIRRIISHTASQADQFQHMSSSYVDYRESIYYIIYADVGLFIIKWGLNQELDDSQLSKGNSPGGGGEGGWGKGGGGVGQISRGFVLCTIWK